MQERLETWDDLARNARRAANEMVQTRYRSCISRAYYAAYSKVTHDLVATGVSMPRGWEGPNHPGHLPTGEAGDKGIRRMIVDRLTGLSLGKRKTLSRIIGSLYTLRLSADYHPSTVIDDTEAREAVSMMNTVFDAF